MLLHVRRTLDHQNHSNRNSGSSRYDHDKDEWFLPAVWRVLRRRSRCRAGCGRGSRIDHHAVRRAVCNRLDLVTHGNLKSALAAHHQQLFRADPSYLRHGRLGSTRLNRRAVGHQTEFLALARGQYHLASRQIRRKPIRRLVHYHSTASDQARLARIQNERAAYRPARFAAGLHRTRLSLQSPCHYRRWRVPPAG